MLDTTGPAWQIGDVRQLEVRITRPEMAPGSSTTPVELTVLSEDDTGWLMRWEADATVLGNFDISGEATAALQDFAARAPREVVEYRLDRTGAFTSVENIAGIRDAAIAGLELLVETGALPADEEFVGLRRLYENMPDEGIAGMFAERPMIYHALDGVALAPGERFELTDELENAFGGSPFPALATVSRGAERDADGCVVFDYAVTPDPAQFGVVLAETLTAGGFLPEGGDIETDLAELGEFDVEHRLLARYDAATGRLWRLEAVESVVAAGHGQTVRTTITDVTS